MVLGQVNKKKTYITKWGFCVCQNVALKMHRLCSGSKDTPEHILLQAGIPRVAPFFIWFAVWLPSKILFYQSVLLQKGTYVVFPALHLFSLLLVIDPQFSLGNIPSSAPTPCDSGAFQAPSFWPCQSLYYTSDTIPSYTHYCDWQMTQWSNETQPRTSGFVKEAHLLPGVPKLEAISATSWGELV